MRRKWSTFIHTLHYRGVIPENELVIYRAWRPDRSVRSGINIANRPHVKTHKIPAIAPMQLAAGAVCITCQKLSEAQVMADAGIIYNILR